MKRLTTVFIISIISFKISIAQKPQPGEYRINNDIDKFLPSLVLNAQTVRAEAWSFTSKAYL
jgi:hypothetical protein